MPLDHPTLHSKRSSTICQPSSNRPFAAWKRIIVAVLVLLCPSLTAADEDSDFRSAAAFFRAQRWQYAATDFQKFLKDYPNSDRAPLARLYVGLCLNSLEDYAPARTNLQQFLKDAPENRNAADARYRIGECSYYLKEYDTAIQQLANYLKQHDGHQLNSWARLLLGESLNQKQRFVEAQTTLAPVLAVAQKDGILDDVEFAIAVSLQGQSKVSEATVKFQNLVNRKSKRFEHRSLARLGMMAFAAKDYAKAATLYDRLIKDHPQKPGTTTATLQSGIAYYQLGNFEAAIQRFQKIPADDSAAGYGQLWTGLAFTQTKQIEKARQLFANAFQNTSDPTLSAELLFRRAELEMIDQQMPAAIAMFKDLTDRWPTCRYVNQSLLNIADLQLEQGNLPEATDAIQRLLKADPEKANHPDLMTVRGRLLLKQDRLPEAIKLLTEAANAPADSKDLSHIRTYHLVRALHKAGKHQEVLGQVKRVADELQQETDSNIAAMLSLAAISSLEINENQSAFNFADRFIQLSPDIATQADALTARAIAASRTNQLKSARTDLKTLVTNFKSTTATWIAVLQSAEATWAAKQYAESAEFFDLAIGKETTPRIQRMALSGAGWSYFRQNDQAKAKDRFQQLIQNHPAANETTEGRYVLGRILVDEKNQEAAAEQFKVVFTTLKSSVPENQQPDDVRYLFSSGRYYAQLQGRLNQIDQANATWKELAGLFDRSPKLDQILDEWAVANLQAARFDQSDQIYRTLLERFPNSPFAGQARLSLAESQMQGDNLQPALAEFQAITANPNYAPREKAAALYHIVDIQAARQQWATVQTTANQFLKNYPSHDRAAEIQLLSAEALVNQKQYQQAGRQLVALQQAVQNGELPKADWTGRIWVLLAESALAEKRYDEIDRLANDLAQNQPASKWMFQARFLQGRRWKSQAPPNFARARQYFEEVTSDEQVQGTETAARSQFLIAETYLLQENFADAAREYHRVHLIYNIPEWQARSLFQAAACEERLSKTNEATRSYSELIAEFPNHNLVPKAKERLQVLKTNPQ